MKKVLATCRVGSISVENEGGGLRKVLESKLVFVQKNHFLPIYVVLEIRISTNCDCGQKNVKRQFFAIFESGNLNIHSNTDSNIFFSRNIRIWKDCFSQFDHVTS